MGGSKYLFSDLIGNTININLLRRSIEKNTFKPFTIFSGILGTGKSTCAKIAAMALTCDDPTDGQPCLKCEVCKQNLAAFSTTGESMWVKVINAGKLINRSDVNAIIHEMFELQSNTHNRVFIVEEAHALTAIPGSETAFLTEIDKMPGNTYVLMCTTKISDIIDELQSRALVYSFQRLTDAEARLLLESEANKRSVVLSARTSALILQNGCGIPRNIISSLEYVIDNEVSEEELLSFLRVIDNASLFQLFSSMRSTEMSLYAETLNTLLSGNSAKEVFDAIKEYVVKIVFLIEGGINEEFNSFEKAEIEDIFHTESLRKIVTLLDRPGYRISNADLELLLYKIRLIIQKRKYINVIEESGKIAAAEKIHANEMRAELDGQQVANLKLKKLTAEKLNCF